MTTNIMLLKYNNYFNRQVKILDSVEQYQSYQVGDFILNVNFIPNDGVTTELIINYNNEEIPNYLIVIDNNVNIQSRWFIIDSVRTRGGQFKLSLKRDVIADSYKDIIKAPMLINKGYVNVDNPLIFNREEMTVNQIKTSETLLKDRTNCGWIVGYVDPKYPQEDVQITRALIEQPVPDITNYEFKDLIGQNINGPLSKETHVTYEFYSNQTPSAARDAVNRVHHYLDSHISADGTTVNHGELIVGIDCYTGNLGESRKDREIGIKNFIAYDPFLNPSNMALIKNNITQDELSRILASEGEIYSQNGKTYKIKISSESIVEKFDMTISGYPRVYNGIDATLVGFAENYDYIIQSGGDYYIPTTLIYQRYSIKLDEITAPGTYGQVTISASSRKAADAPYKLFCIPYEARIKIGENRFYMDSKYSLGLASALIETLQPASGTGGGHLYDIQLLPYCPIPHLFIPLDDGYVELASTARQGTDYNVVKDRQAIPNGIILYSENASFHENIQYFVDIPSNSLEFKVSRETSKYRLSSPNFANFEDFDPYMNKGVRNIEVDCTYKPYTPYIKLNIDFKGLYGKDFNDSRGLICGGDYSIPMISDAWRTYEIQNKNYANIFERETQHLEVEHKIGMVQSAVGGLAGAVGAGAVGGRLAGPVGAAVGGGLSIVGAGMDLATSQYRHEESMDLRKDMYNFNIQNIQAKPIGLVKTSAFNYNNKIWPFVEYYTSTLVEKELLRNKIKYNGMTINAIGTINQFTSPGKETFISGTVIRLQELNDDSHMALAINSELEKGVYI